jgi:hypothetical protein
MPKIRCANGTRRNKKSGNCESKSNVKVRTRCKNGTRRNKKTGNCEPKRNQMNFVLNQKTNFRIPLYDRRKFSNSK